VGTQSEVLAQVRGPEPAPPPTRWRPDLDPGLQEVCLKALAKRPDDRFADMAAFADALGWWLELRQAPARAAPAPAPVPADPRLDAEALGLLRQWGWQAGLERLKATIQGADAARAAGLRLVLGWQAAERGRYAEALENLRALEAGSALAGWALVGQALAALRERDYPLARSLLARAGQADPQDAILGATIAHHRGTLAHHEGRSDEALAELHTALELLGRDHFSTGRVLDTLGMVHATRNDFSAACAFYAQALELKQRVSDDAGVALTHGQLGRLYLDWELPERADEHLRQGIALARRLGDERGEAQLTNHRGQVMLQRGRTAEAAALLDASVQGAQGRYTVVEGFARKDRALLHLALGEVEAAERACDGAEARFQAAQFAEGVWHVQRVRGLVRLAQGRHEESARCLRESAACFAAGGEPAEAARSLWELARTLRAQGAAAPLVSSALLAALEAAEESRRGRLVAALERELAAVAEVEQVRHACGRFQKPGMPDGMTEAATVLLVELRTEGGADDPLAAPATRADLYTELEGVLAGVGVAVDQYRAEGFLAVVRGRDHAGRAVAAALGAAAAVAERNRPRRVLGWPLWELYAGLGSGVVWLGQVGTYQKRDVAAAGLPVQAAAGLQAEARPGLPCVSEATHQLIAGSFAFRPDGPRTVQVTGLGPQRAWDVIGRRR
jgi:tetratricopeptide (TPR) repeat protein